MKLVFVSSPLRGNYVKNTELARSYCRFVINAGNSPVAPHLFFPALLDDNINEERDLGISCGLKWLEKSDEMWVFADSADSCSDGMKVELDYAAKNGIPVRFIPPKTVNSMPR